MWCGLCPPPYPFYTHTAAELPSWRGGGALPRGGEPSEARLGFKLTLPLFPFSKTARRERLASKTSSPRLSPRLACLGVVMRVCF